MVVAWVTAQEVKTMSPIRLSTRSRLKDSRITKKSKRNRKKRRMMRRMKKSQMTTTSIWKMILTVKWKTWKLQKMMMKRIRNLTKKMMS